MLLLLLHVYGCELCACVSCGIWADICSLGFVVGDGSAVRHQPWAELACQHGGCHRAQSAHWRRAPTLAFHLCLQLQRLVQNCHCSSCVCACRRLTGLACKPATNYWSHFEQPSMHADRHALYYSHRRDFQRTIWCCQPWVQFAVAYIPQVTQPSQHLLDQLGTWQ